MGGQVCRYALGWLVKDQYTSRPLVLEETWEKFSHKENWTYLEIKTVEQLRDECEGREEDLQGIGIGSMSLTQLNSSLQQRRKNVKYKCLHIVVLHN